jgi:hypothetical protein
MTLRLEDIAPLSQPPLLARRVRRTDGSRSLYRPTRRQLLRDAALVGTFVSISALGLLPPARRAGAHHGTWHEWPSCSGLPYTGDDDCNGCQQGRFYGCCHPNGYHASELTSCRCRHRPNDCKDDYYDLWYWSTALCCWVGCHQCRKNRKWRCSDGYHRTNCSAGFTTLSICRYVVSSGSGCTPCPC